MTARRFSTLAAIVALTGLFGPHLLLAQGSTTATVKGRVVDSDDAGLPGVIVQIRSGSQPSGNKQVPTDIEGNYRIPLLPPANDYMIKIDYPGFAPLELGPLDLDTGKTTVQNITLRTDAESTETITVESQGNIVDTESTKTASSYNAEFIEGLPIIGSNYQDILTLAPGVTDTDGDGNPNVHGARDTGLQYRLDGGNITDPVDGGFGQNLNTDIIEEVEIITSGASAEFGRADGGFTNIITKSGGNDFEGKFTIRYRSKFLNGDGTGDNDVNNFTDDVPDYSDVRPTLTLGGAIVRDKLWYFGSLQIIDAERPVQQVGNTRLQTFRGHTGLAKLTWQTNSYNKLAFQINTDPLEFTGNNIGLGTSPDSDVTFTQGGLVPQVKWTSTISPQLLLESLVTHFESGIAVEPVSKHFEPTPTELVLGAVGVIQSIYPCGTINCDPKLGEESTYQIDLIQGTINGPFRFQTDDERIRNSIKTDLTYNVEDAWGQHNVKSGIEFADEKFSDEPITNPFLVDVTTPFESTQTSGGGVVNPLAVDGFQQVTAFSPLVTPQDASSFNSSIYALDSWKPIPNLTVNYGLRLDREDTNTSGFKYFDPKQERQDAIGLWSKVCIEAQYQAQTRPGLVQTGSNCDAFRPGDEAPFDGKPPTAIANNQMALYRDENFDGINDVDPDVASLDFNKDGVLEFANKEGEQLYRDLTTFAERETENFSIENTNVSPRFSVSWDPWADGKSKTFASWGRFYDRLFLSTITGEIGPDSINFTFLPNDLTHLITPGQLSLTTSSVTVNQIDRDLETPYTDEWTIGFERELAPEWSGSITYIHRDGNNLLQDQDINHVTCAQHGEIGIDPFVACGGAGILEDDKFGGVAGFENISSGGNFAFGFFVPNQAPDLYTVNNNFNQILRVGNYNSSEYDAFELKIVKRLQHNWQMQFSYTWSEAFGQAEAFSTAAGNDPQLKDDEEGYLDFDQTHILKFQAVTRLPHEIVLGSVIQWSSGVPWSVTKTVVEFDSTGNTLFRSFYPTGQRNDQRNSGWWKIDGRLEKNFVVGRVQASAFLLAENLLDEGQLTIEELDTAALGGLPLDAFRDFGRRFEIGASFDF